MGVGVGWVSLSFHPSPNKGLAEGGAVIQPPTTDKQLSSALHKQDRPSRATPCIAFTGFSASLLYSRGLEPWAGVVFGVPEHRRLISRRQRGLVWPRGRGPQDLFLASSPAQSCAAVTLKMSVSLPLSPLGPSGKGLPIFFGCRVACLSGLLGRTAPHAES